MKKTITIELELTPSDSLEVTSAGWVTLYKMTAESLVAVKAMGNVSLGKSRPWIGCKFDDLHPDMQAKVKARKAKAPKANAPKDMGVW